MAGWRTVACSGRGNPVWKASRRPPSKFSQRAKRMKTYLDCWISAATTLFSQALAGEAQLTEMESTPPLVFGPSFVCEMHGDVAGQFTVTLDPEIVKAPLLGGGVDQAAAWAGSRP